MFTGIIEECGEVKEFDLRKGFIRIGAKHVLEGIKAGDSIAVNGTCLTVITLGKELFTANVSPETVQRTIIPFLKRGQKVNLERPLKLSDRLGGHIVTGHTDDTGTVSFIDKKRDDYWEMGIKVPERFLPYIVEKGSIAVNGVSLTIASLKGGEFSIALIPHTIKETNLKDLRIGEKVNLELDILGKYVESLLKKDKKASFLMTIDSLKEMGY
jgi:riboflavin synthase